MLQYPGLADGIGYRLAGGLLQLPDPVRQF